MGLQRQARRPEEVLTLARSRSVERCNLFQRLAKQALSIGKLVGPPIPEFGPLGFKPSSLVGPSGTAEKIGQGSPRAGKTGGVAQIVIQLRTPRRKLVQ